jgi:hypothetical protein
MKIAGIIADNYKLPMFEKELKTAGLIKYKILPFGGDTSKIMVELNEKIMDAELLVIKIICEKVEWFYKKRN